MPYLLIILLSFSILLAQQGQAMNVEPRCGVPCFACKPRCLAKFRRLPYEQWDMKISKSKCGPGRDICDCCLISHYQEMRVSIKNRQGTQERETKLVGDSSVLCGCCCFIRLSSEQPNTITVSAKETEITYYDHFQFMHVVGCTDVAIGEHEIFSCNILGNGPILIKEGLRRGFDWLCCFVQSGVDETPRPRATSEDSF